MRRMLRAAVLIVIWAPAALAQVSPTNTQDDDEYHKAEIFVGYSQAHENVLDSERFNGFNTSATGNLASYFGLKFDVAGHYKSDRFGNASIYNVLGGVQVKDNSKTGRFKPFAHLLAGVARRKASFTGFGSFSDTGFSLVAGAGLDIRVVKRLDVRVGQVDYNLTRFNGGTGHGFRLGVGIVLH